MKFATSIKTLVLLAATSLLAACGGGGGSDSDSGFTPQGLTLTTSTSSISANPRSLVTITATLRRDNAGTVPDGSTVTATVNGAGLGNLSTGGGNNGATATGTTVGGVVNFYFQTGGNPGSGSITFSAQDTTTPGRTVSRTVNVTVGSGPGSDPRISFTPTKTEIAVNTDSVGFFLGSPYIAEVDVDVRSASGQPLNSENTGEDAIQFSVTPLERGFVSVPDDPETEDNELTSRYSAIFTGIAAGKSKAFVWSSTQPGTITLHAAFTDPDTGQRVEGQISFNVTTNVPPLPGAISVTAPSAPIYASDSGGPSTGTISVYVTDGAGSPVPNPVQGANAYNNVRLDLLPGVTDGDAVLTGTDASGASQQGTSIRVRTTNGLANALIRAGVKTGAYIIRATSDRADNNVDNGITDPIVGERTFIVSDGQLFSLKIVSPDVEAIIANRVDTGVIVDDEEVPGGFDGTYSLTVSAIATDRQGNPVLPGTPIEFGLIDEPLVGFPENGPGEFDVSGFDGNPQEGGSLFTAPTGHFTTSAGGPNDAAGPGDTLLVFGQEVPGNRDLESARTVAQVNSATSLTVTHPFNRNDDTGVSVDFGNVLPYVVGRATVGTVGATATTNDMGVATTTLNYPVSVLGKRFGLWARSATNVSAGGQKLVSDVTQAVYPGIAAATLIASPSAIPGNSTSLVTLCLLDANSSPIQGVFIDFSFALESGTGRVDGQPNSGSTNIATGPSGCTIAEVVTTGVTEGENEVVFSVPGAEPAPVEITSSGGLLLQASPTAILGNGSYTINLRLLDGSGSGVQGVAIAGTCEGSGETAIVNISAQPNPTNAEGRTTATIVASQMDQPDGGAEWTCTFAVAGGEPSAVVTIKGRDSCAIGEQASPPAPDDACEDTSTPPAEFTLSVILNAPAATSATISGSLLCTASAGTTEECDAPFAEGTVANLQVTPAVNDYMANVVGDCAVIDRDEDGAGRTVTFVRSAPLTSDLECEITVVQDPD